MSPLGTPPQVQPPNSQLEAVLPVAELQSLLDAFNDVFPAVTAILDREGRILQASGWQDICTKFHRATPASCRNCTESDTWLAQNVKPGEFVAYHCKNGLNDVVTPLYIDGTHAGNLYTGQFFYDDEPVDEQRFREQAATFGFDEAQYLEALRRVPRVSRKRVEAVMDFIVRLTALLSQLGQANRQLVHQLAERQRLYNALEAAEKNRRALEASMQQAQKLESLGLLAGGIAHDFNNLLASISSSIEAARGDLAEGSDAAQALSLGLSATQRASELTRQLLAYSGRGRFEAKHVDLAHLVAESAELLRTLVPRQVELAFEHASEPAGVEADRTQLQQVMTNLLTNAAEATGERGGRVTLRTGVVEATNALLAQNRLPGSPRAGRYAFFEVQDQGAGMDPSTLEHLFEPFFTTKFAGRGLGMAAVHGIVTNHGGALLIDTAPGRGTTVRALFPWVAAPAPVQGSAPKTRKPAGERGELLVVDDELIVASSLGRLLRRLGFTAHVVQNGPAALAAFEAKRGQFTGAIIDVTMPVMTGPELATRLHALAPGLPIVLTSGYDLDPVTRDIGAWLTGFLPKPYSLDELEAVLDRISARAG